MSRSIVDPWRHLLSRCHWNRWVGDLRVGGKVIRRAHTQRPVWRTTVDDLDLWRQVLTAETELQNATAALNHPGVLKLELAAQSELRDQVAAAELILTRLRRRWLRHTSGSDQGGPDSV
jgi:hypothetical protein